MISKKERSSIYFFGQVIHINVNTNKNELQGWIAATKPYVYDILTNYQLIDILSIDSLCNVGGD